MNLSIDPSIELLSKYRKALGNAEMGLWELDFSSQTITWDEGIRLLYRFRKKIYSGPIINFLQRIRFEDSERIRINIENARLDLCEFDGLFRITLSDGSEKFIRTNAAKVRDENKKVTGLIGMNWDVTQEYRVQEDLNNSKFFLEKILDAIPDPVFIKDRMHRTIFANKEFEKISGKNKSEIIGKLDSDFLSPDVAQFYWEVDEQIFRGNQYHEYEESIQDSSGQIRHLLTKKTSLPLSDKEQVLVGVIRDISEVKKIQHSLVEQSKMASLGEMAAEIAHEINNPLMIIQAKSQILQDRLNSKISPVDTMKIIQDLQSIEKNGYRIDKIIKSLKSVSRKSNEDPFEDVSIRKLVEESIEISQERLNKHQVQFDFLFDKIIDYSYSVRARSSELVQVLVNLLNNSFDAIQDTVHPWIRINLRLVGSEFYIEVIDSGVPILPEVAQKMLEPFFTTKTAGAGTGLGLSVSKQIIQKHNGRFYYDPTSINTKFVFQLKRSESVSKL